MFIKFWKNYFMRNLFLYAEGDGAGGGGGAGGGETTFTQAQLNDAVEQAKAGLIAKNTELLGKMNNMKEQLSKFDGIDLDAINAMQKKFKDDTEKELYEREGFEGVVNHRLKDVTTQHESQLKERDDKIASLTEERDGYVNRYNTGLINDALRTAAVKSGILPTAIEDVLLRGANVFSVGEEDAIEARGKDGELRKTSDGKAMLNPETFVEELRELCPHMWPGSKGAGAQGSGRVSPTADIDVQMAAAADAGDMKLYKKLREERRKAAQ